MSEFNYTYRAVSESERKEIESIRSRYEQAPSANSGIAELRRLNSLVNNTPTIIALVIGIISTLIFGFGLTLVLEWNYIVQVIIVMVVSIPFVVSAYPFYKLILKINKKKYGPKIIELSEKLLNESEK